MHMMIKNMFILFLAMIMAGCGSTMKIKKPIDEKLSLQQLNHQYDIEEIATKIDNIPEHFISAIKGHLKVEMSKRQLLADENSNAVNKVDIDVTYYRMRTGIARDYFGIFAGKDGVKSNVKVVNGNGELIGESEVSTFNVTALGNDDDIARMHAKKIAEFLAVKKL